MRIGFDARSLRRHWGRGVGRFWKGFWERLWSEDAEDEFVLYLTRRAVPALEDLCPPAVRNALGDRLAVRCSKPLREELAWLWEQVTAPRYIRRDRIDVFHASVQQSVPLLGGENVVAHIFDMMPIVNAPLYVAGRGGSVGAKIRLYERYLKTALPRVGRMIAISERTKRDIVDVTGADPERIRVVHLAVEDRFRPVEGAGEEIRRLYGVPERYLLYAGGIEYRKGCDHLLRAFRRLAEKDREISLVIVGGTDGRYPAEIVRLTKDLGLRDRVFFTGYVPDEHLPLFYNGAEIFIYPSTYEGFGLPVLEAMACGAPVITTSGTSIPEVSGNAAYLVPAGDEEALWAGIEELRSDPERRRNLGARGIERAAKFTWERVLRETRAVYEEVYRETH